MRRPELTILQILDWADAFYSRNRRWPNKDSGRIPGSLGETWMAVEMALRNGGRGMSVRGMSLPRLLARERGVRNRLQLPRFTVDLILEWARSYRERTGMWPSDDSGHIPESPASDTWETVDRALRCGWRGLPGGSSLYRVLAAYCHIGIHRRRPPLTEVHILEWADAFHARTGYWPSKHSGEVLEAPGMTWMGIHFALREGRRGLPGRSSLVKLLRMHRGARPVRRAVLSPQQILCWARAYRRRNGRWPTSKSGRVPKTRRLTWQAVDIALRKGLRGLPGGSSLRELLHAQTREMSVSVR